MANSSMNGVRGAEEGQLELVVEGGEGPVAPAQGQGNGMVQVQQ
jgi:hypothetical protein